MTEQDIGQGNGSFCRYKWNDQQGYIKRDPMEIVDCCLDSCYNYVDICKSNCADAKNCHKCNDLERNCFACYSMVQDEVDYIDKCIGERCYKNDNNTNCVKNYRKEILNCCKQNCVANHSITDCNKHCEKILNLNQGRTNFKFFNPIEKNDSYMSLTIISVLSLLLLILLKLKK